MIHCKTTLLVACAVLLFTGMPAMSQNTTPADSAIKSALYDIEKYEKQFASKTRIPAPTLRRTIKLLRLSRDRLDSSSNQSDPSWTEADARYKALMARLEAFGAQKPGATTSAPVPQPSPATPASAVPKVAAPSAMISQQRVRLAKLIRDIASTTDDLDKAGAGPFQDKVYVDKQMERKERFMQSLAKFDAFADDPEVVKAKAAMEKFDGFIALGKREAAKVLAEVGDAHGTIREIEERMKAVKQPKAPQFPYAEGAIKTYLQAGFEIRAMQEKDHALMQKVAAKAYFPKPAQSRPGQYSTEDLKLVHFQWSGKTDMFFRQVNILEANLTAQVESIARDLATINGYDPANQDDQFNGFLSGTAKANMLGRLKEHESVARAAVEFSTVLQQPNPEFNKALVAVREARTKYQANSLKALGLVRMPASIDKPKKLAEIARKALANPKYDIGPIERLVVNVEQSHHETESSEMEIDDVDISISGDIKLSGTKTTTRYVWDQFQVATAEKEEDKVFIYYNTLKLYTAGGPSTPLNRWVVGKRFRHCEIQKANISK